ncbi:MAG TPA: hypothetical protein VGY97_08550 [Solirubrobacteraceae bacterium]|jgi:hypothetical protein|nr:hypothetical protein [Solirubrobacteraceae bacterium]
MNKTSPAGAETNPSRRPAAWTRSLLDRRDTSARSAAFWRSSADVVWTARPIPVLSRSRETCMATIPISANPISAIHPRPRMRRSSSR